MPRYDPVVLMVNLYDEKCFPQRFICSINQEIHLVWRSHHVVVVITMRPIGRGTVYVDERCLRV